jgi:hypothetical protein
VIAIRLIQDLSGFPLAAHMKPNIDAFHNKNDSAPENLRVKQANNAT